ncbi:MAG: metallophosphoesterase [Bryobacteraceae bacterium]
MPRFQVFSDIHNDLKALEKLMATEADAYIAAGDLANFARGLDKAGEVMKAWAGRVYVIPGNHESASQIESFCKRFGFVNLHAQSAMIEGVRVSALGYSTITPFDTPGEYTEDQIAQRLAPFAEFRPEVLICHSPPLHTPLDRIREGLHAGSKSVREFIEACQPAHFFCGHIHEAEGVVHQMGATRCMNVGKKGYLLEL